MKKLISIIAATALLAGCVTGPERKNAKPSEASGIFEQQVEKEIRKQDSWVEREVRQDYTANEKQGRVQLKKYPQRYIELSKKHGHIEFSAAYSDKLDTLFLLGSTNAAEIARTVKAITHESWHALYDSEGKKGLIHSTNYLGPSLEEIASFCSKKTGGREFDELRTNLLVAAEIQDFNIVTIGFISNFGVQMMNAVNKYKDTLSLAEEKRQEKLPVSQEEWEEINKKSNALQTNILDFQRDFSQFYASVSSLTNQNSGALTLEQIRGAKQKVLSEVGKLQPYESIPKKVKEFREYALKVFNGAKERDIKAEIAEAEKKGDKEFAKFLRDFANLDTNASRAAVIMDSLQSSLVSLGALEKKLVFADNALKIAQIVGEPNEVMARAVDSLYSLYYGPVVQSNFSLTEQDLQFLGRFRVMQNGKEVQLFRKGIEKYQLGRKMIAGGYNPKKIKEALEYATEFSYKGKRYSWPSSHFKIKGKIPIHEMNSSE
jgi:ribosomal protein L9